MGEGVGVSLLRLVFRLLLGRRLPRTEGRLDVPGLFGPVRIGRDRYGIVLLEADDPRDGPFALGFCHAQDRLFQLELLLRVARGTLAEMVGAEAVPIDRMARRIGFHRAASAQWEVLDADVRERIEHYSRGVQAGALYGLSALPHEFALLKARPTPWTPLDTLGVTKLLSFTLAANWDAELVRQKVLSSDGPEAVRAVDTAYPAWQPTSVSTTATGPVVDRLADDLAALLAWVRPGGGSNNWVLASSKTATGRPILANDPHLDARLPLPWYLVSLRTPAEAVAGATFVGGPVWLAGHNGHAAWGLTAGLADNTDLFLEEIGGDGASIRQGDTFVPCAVIDEPIAVRGGSPLRERVLITPRGPVISPALYGTPQALSLSAIWLQPRPLGGFFRLHHVRSFAEFRAAFEHWPVSSQNLVYADVGGTIGQQLVGQVPVRQAGHGALPLPGWRPETGWQPEPVPYQAMPHQQDPPEGFLATANTRPLPDDQGPFLGIDFIDGYRLASIRQALLARSDWDVAATLRLQTDQRARAWQEMRAIVLAAPATDEATRQALELLAAWDGIAGAASSAAAVYELFLAEMTARAMRAKAPGSWRWLLGAGLSPINPYNFVSFRRTAHLVRLFREQPAGWFHRSWSAEIADALAETVRGLRQRFGRDPARWAWGTIRPIVLRHPLASRPGLLGKALGAVFNLGPLPGGGDADVINQAAVLPLHPLTASENIASLRLVIDVGAWQNSRFVIPGGQSGNPLSPHYADLLPLWQRGDAVPIAFTTEEMRAAATQTLELRPTDASPGQ